MMKRSTFLTGLFALTVLAASAQDTTRRSASEPAQVSSMKMESTAQGRPGKLSYKQKLQYANNLLNAGNYFEAMVLFKELNDKKATDVNTVWGIAEAERQARDYSTAETWYKKVIELDPKKFDLTYYHYGQVLMMNGKYDEAKAAFAQFTSSESSNNDLKSELRHAKVESDGCDFALNAIKNPVEYSITHLDAPLNKPRTEFAPVVTSENTMYYSSINNDSILNGALQKSGDSAVYAHIYLSTKQGGKWAEGKPLPTPINSAEFHSGYSAITADGKRMYFTECGSEQSVNSITCKIFVSTLDNGVWAKPRPLPEKINKAESDNTQPWVVQGTDADTLYFSSNRAGGKGGYDIYYSVIKVSGGISEPVNLGEPVNTEWDEKTPSYWPKKGILFFSSNGHVGLGGFDNYSTTKADKGWNEPQNLGYPVNSSADDYGYSSGEDNKTLFYFVSNRVGIIGLKSATCCDDIWQAKNTFVPKLAVSGELIERIDSSETHPMDGARVEVYDVTNGIPTLVYADSLPGKTQYFYNLQPDKKYNIKFMKAGHFPKYTDISTMNAEKSDTFSHSITLDKIVVNKSYVLGNIYYEYKSSALNENSRITLDTLYSLLKENPEIVIELSSHTDSIGSDSYNMNLSQQRAEACADYLYAKGIDSSRVIPKGYGRSQPVAPNSINGKDNPEGRALNRRTQYKVIGNLKQKGDKVIFESAEPPKDYKTTRKEETGGKKKKK